MNRAPQQPSRLNFRRAILMGVAAYILYSLGGWAYDRFFRSEEDHIRDVLQGAIAGANDRTPRDVTRILSLDFKGPHGITRDEAHQGFMIVLMQEYRVVKFELAPMPVPVELDPTDKKRASATFKILGQGKYDESGSWEDIGKKVAEHFGTASNTTVKARFKKTDEGWLMDSIDLVERSQEAEKTGQR